MSISCPELVIQSGHEKLAETRKRAPYKGDHPHEAAFLVRKRMPRPETGMDTEDHNSGVFLVRAAAGYLDTRGTAVRRFLGAVWEDITPIRKELSDVIARRWANRDPEDRTDYRRMMEMKSPEFAEKLVADESDKLERGR